VLSLFPNTTDLKINWQLSNDGISGLDPNHSGDHLKYLKRLKITLGSNHYGTVSETLHAYEDKVIIDHFHMPSLKSVAVDFQVSGDGREYTDDFKAICEALCGIESPGLRDITVKAVMPIRQPPFPEAWVSPS
jgi:hypothetical protein